MHLGARIARSRGPRAILALRVDVELLAAQWELDAPFELDHELTEARHQACERARSEPGRAPTLSLGDRWRIRVATSGQHTPLERHAGFEGQRRSQIDSNRAPFDPRGQQIEARFDAGFDHTPGAEPEQRQPETHRVHFEHPSNADTLRE